MVTQTIDGNNYWGMFIYSPAGGNHRFTFECIQGGVAVYSSGYLNSPVALSTGVWYHVALVRSGTNFYYFLNGNSFASPPTSSASLPDFNALLYVGSYGTLGHELNGWLDEFRVSKGVPRWTSNFTPPIGPYARDANAVLLLHMDGADASTTFIDSY